MDEMTNLKVYFPNREKIESDIDSLDIDWAAALLEWNDSLECQLEDGEISHAEVIDKAVSYKTAFIEGILCGSQLSTNEAMPLLIQGILDYGWDHDGGKQPYIDSAFAYWDRNFLLENGREPSNEELISWQTEEVIEQYVKGGFKQFEEMEDDMGWLSDHIEILKYAWKEFLRCDIPQKAAALAYGTYINLFVYLKDFW